MGTNVNVQNYHNVYLNRPDPIVFLPLTVHTSDRLYDDFIRLFFCHPHRESSVLTNELPEESDQFRFLRGACCDSLKGTVGLIMVNFPRTFSSLFCLNVTCCVFILDFHIDFFGFCVYHCFDVTFSFP